MIRPVMGYLAADSLFCGYGMALATPQGTGPQAIYSKYTNHITIVLIPTLVLLYYAMTWSKNYILSKRALLYKIR